MRGGLCRSLAACAGPYWSDGQSQVDPAVGGSPTPVVLNLASTLSLINLSPTVKLYIQLLTLTGLAPTDLSSSSASSSPSASSDSIQRHALPLWTFVATR